MPCQMKDPSRENNFIIRTRAKQLRIKNKLNPDSREKNIFPNNVYRDCYKLLNISSLLIQTCQTVVTFRITKFARFFTFALVRLALSLANTSLKRKQLRKLDEFWQSYGLLSHSPLRVGNYIN